MSIEQAMILRAQPRILTQRLSALVQREVTKGCLPSIFPMPVGLEPRYHRILDDSTGDGSDFAVPEDPINPRERIRLRVWISPNQKHDWNYSEIFLKQLAIVSHRLAFEVVGNKEDIRVFLLCHKEDLSIVSAAFRGAFDSCEISKVCSGSGEGVEIGGCSVAFMDFYPPPPYSHLLTSHEELRISPLASLLQFLSQIPAGIRGFYQAVFRPVNPLHDWHRNVETLLDMEYEIKLHSSMNLTRQYFQQAPSGDLHQMAQDLDTKAHSDKPFFHIAVRVGLLANRRFGRTQLLPLSAWLSLFQHGGRPLEHLTHEDYEQVLPVSLHMPMVARGMTYRPGFLVNSRELTGLVHVFPAAILEARRLKSEVLETLPVRGEEIRKGTCIGHCEYAGLRDVVCIPDDVRALSTHIVSSPGMGKSALMEIMFLHDLLSGNGAVFIDPHGDAVKDLLELIPPALYPKVIYFNPGDPEWIPCWNPLHCGPGVDRYRMADDVVGTFKRIFRDWGDRLEHVIRNGIIGLSFLSKSCFLDLYHLTRQKSDESEELRKMIVRSSADEPVKKFWQTDFLKDYRKSELQSPRHKLSKLVSAGSVSMMLSQRENRIDTEATMRDGKALLVDLSDVGDETKEALGSFMLSDFLTAAIRRSSMRKEERRPFSVYADEVHLFASGDAIESILAQVRKFGVNLCVAHQFLSQFGTSKVDALSMAGTTILGRLDKRDSQYFTKDFRDLVEAKDLMALQKRQMIARIGTEVVRFRTRDLPDRPASSDPTAIIENTHRNYCKPAAEVRKAMGRRGEEWYLGFSPSDGEGDGSRCEEDLAYEEF